MPPWGDTGTSSRCASSHKGWKSGPLKSFPPGVAEGRTAPTIPSSSTLRRNSLTASSMSWMGSSATPTRRGLTRMKRSCSQSL